MGFHTSHWLSRRHCSMSTALLLTILVYISLWTLSLVAWTSHSTGSDVISMSLDLSHQYFAKQTVNGDPAQGGGNGGLSGNTSLPKTSKTGSDGTGGQYNNDLILGPVADRLETTLEDFDVVDKYHKNTRSLKPSKNKTSKIGHSKDASMYSSGGKQRSSDFDNIRKYFIGRENMTNSFVNLHRYHFSMKPVMCSSNAHIKIIILVHSAVGHFENRQTIRRSLHDKRTRTGILFEFVFLLGQTLNTSLHRKLTAESEKYKDIVQGNFTDSYQNMTYKHIMGHHWVVHNCRHVNYVIKIDDDVIVNVENAVNYISTKRIKEGQIVCSANLKSKIKTFGKWVPKKNQFPFDHYPPYCSGFAYLAPMSVIKRLYGASSSVRMYWIDDVYITGLLTLATNTTIVALSNMEAYKHLVKSPIPTYIMKKALFIFNDPGYTYGRYS
ncbi:beta-1,3-galactosyltransferase brn-like [Haliotis cracherodii]|uniref:beta-1,3-galactosyltransferase brn-like n=1 Tax=Haliotis cracherodii TaxID=6455 RepID=UPI0039E78ECC